MKPRVVIDTNVIVSALLLPRSVPRQVVDWAICYGQILVSEPTLVELWDVLSRPKFEKYFSKGRRLDFFAALVREAEVIDVEHDIVECRDPKDNKFLEVAVSGAANYIVSGDADLLVLHPFRGIAIVSPQMFLTIRLTQ
jgi:putative PIN family toxin of toxin-antitoxin system